MSHKVFSLPPNHANPQITLPLQTTEDIDSNMRKFRLTAEDASIPIDWRKKLGKSMSAVRNQASCGNCWAMSSTSALTDRFIIKKNLPNLNLNAVMVTQCSPQRTNDGCCGSQPTFAGEFFETTGTVQISPGCPGFNSTMTSYDIDSPAGCDEKNDRTINFPACKNIESKCLSNSPILYKAVKGSTRTVAGTDPANTIFNMKLELNNGPYVVTFNVPYDFMASGWGYKWDKTNGIYITGAYNKELDSKFGDKKQASGIGNWTDFAGWHAVELVGWDKGDIGDGKGATTPYWIVKNSWGPDWNENGYFRVAMNVPETGNLNSGLGLDIPKAGNGGGTTFDPDVSTGDDHGHVHPEPVPDGKDHTDKVRKGKKKIFIILGVIVLSILVLFLLYRGFKYLKQKRRNNAIL